MTAKSYYITTVADWQRHLDRFAQSHWVALDEPISSTVGAPHAVPGEDAAGTSHAQESSVSTDAPAAAEAPMKILVLVEADEGAHLALEDDPAFESLPHPLAQRPISAAAQSALAPHGVAAGATTFDAAEVLVRIHPLLKHRVF